MEENFTLKRGEEFDKKLQYNYSKKMHFEIIWDDQKEALNLKKHKLEFGEAATVFLDPFCVTFYDDAHSDEEDREITVGLSVKSRVLLVVHTERQEGVIRIISARKASPGERKKYEERI